MKTLFAFYVLVLAALAAFLVYEHHIGLAAIVIIGLILSDFKETRK